MSTFPNDIIVQAEAIIRDFTAAGLMVSTAESCTGGLVAGALTEISGSSSVVDRGFVTYTNTAKMEMLGVQEETLIRFGAVSEETARQMVHGALFRSRAAIAVAVTGVAGPGGGSVEKPVGLVHLAAKSRSGGLIHRKMLYGDIGRGEVRLATVRTALGMIQELAQP
ncbi:MULTISPECIES: CinA family protein [unclassified Rhizobium]|uniref:CinA family protein n=1 Tax=unclassified Rhizobium TaxID=2613769 RepID=UPI00146BC24A|nr:MULTISPECIES: CinA family protein [unclassified Rhizobium]MBD9449330.1 CinA family protein [Rhizobium sp. RHZ01]MBD9455223.1 CinA family protein [Rhizobium sp. RHZ02]NMN73664.1 nicotinamide-nucleotide amidase [Rhizobium sp. 57MFTsu3.2]